MKRIWYFVSIPLILILLGTIVQYIPRDNIVKHSKKACDLYTVEDYWPVRNDRVLDNYTDGVMMLVSAGTADEYGWKTFFSSPLYTIRNISQNWIDIFPLESICRNDLNPHKINYQRYWHGYQIFLRPLLYFTDYQHIRKINFYTQVFLFIFVLYVMWKKQAKGLILGWIVSYVIFAPGAIANNMTYSILYYISGITIVLMLLAHKWIKSNLGWPLFFALIGICTCFFDFLTYPIVPLAMALTVLFYFEPEDKFKFLLKKMILLVLSWGFAYVGMWLLKCLLGTVFTDQNIFIDAYNAFLHRASSQTDYLMEEQAITTTYPRWSAVFSTFEILGKSKLAIYTIIFSFAVALAAVLWNFKVCWKWLKQHYVQLMAFGGICCSLPVYCIIVSGHPLQHAEYTYRLSVAVIFPLICMLNFWCIRAREILHDGK